MEKAFYMEANDGKQIYVREWLPQEVKAVVQIMHGMNEHSGRYRDFAAYLNQQGYAVYANDHRGHGRTANSQEDIGYIGDNGFERMMEDQLMLTDTVKQKHPGMPVCILGHSMGSFLAQRYMQVNGQNIAGAILVGSGGVRKDIPLGILVAGLVERFNSDGRSRGMERIVFKGFNSRFDKRSRFEWIARDSKVVDEYLNDPYCGHVFPPSFYFQFLNFLKLLFDPEQVAGAPKELPVIILSGEDDPVGEFGKGIKRLHRQFGEAGSTDLVFKLYKNARHEILNDFGKQTVYEDIVSWLDGKIAAEERQNPDG